jgi:hypothetical protein
MKFSGHRLQLLTVISAQNSQVCIFRHAFFASTMKYSYISLASLNGAE